jgi:16S rRNA (uracil1498-N3)-methyltransferase
MVVLAVGPERGWTPGELDRFAAADFSFLRMGDRILRTEAAALAGAAILLSRMGIL